MTPWMWALLPGALVGAGAFCWILDGAAAGAGPSR